MEQQATYLVFGATGGTGKHFVAQALKDGHRVKALARDPAKLSIQNPSLEIQAGSITDVADLDGLVQGSDFVISMLGDVNLQKDAKINTAFVKKLIPAMRRQGVKRFLYQAGGFSTPPTDTSRHSSGRSSIPSLAVMPVSTKIMKPS